jgi:hypothetical protein
MEPLKMKVCISSERVDLGGDIVTNKAIKDSLPFFLKAPTVRKNFTMQCIGKASNVTEENGQMYAEIEIYDETAKDEIKAGLFRGIGIGASHCVRDENDKKKIVALQLMEIDIVDRPQNPDCYFKPGGNA